MKRLKRFLLFVPLLLVFAGSAFGQQNQNVTVQFGLQIGPSHSAELHWVASVSSGVSSYKVWRSTVSGSAYVLISTVSGSTLTYTDGGLPAGNTYFYVITAVSSSGESGFSNQVTANVPTP